MRIVVPEAGTPLIQQKIEIVQYLYLEDSCGLFSHILQGLSTVVEETEVITKSVGKKYKKTQDTQTMCIIYMCREFATVNCDFLFSVHWFTH